jgi:hypothetical protein
MTTNLIVRDIPKENRNEGLEKSPFYGYRANIPCQDGKNDQAVLIFSYWHELEKWWRVGVVDHLSKQAHVSDYKESEILMPVIA